MPARSTPHVSPSMKIVSGVTLRVALISSGVRAHEKNRQGLGRNRSILSQSGDFGDGKEKPGLHHAPQIQPIENGTAVRGREALHNNLRELNATLLSDRTDRRQLA